MSKESSTSFFAISGFSIFIAALGYLIYGSIKGAIAVFVLSYALGLLTLLCLLPIFGPIIYWFFARDWLIPKILLLGQIEHTLLITVLFWIELLLIVVVNIIVIIVICAWILDKV